MREEKSSNGKGAHGRIDDSAATARQKELAAKLGIDTYARYPRELLEFRMDRPPRDVTKRAEWKPFPIKGRVYATYVRYSWCWPICLEYAVVTDERDEILHDHRGRPLVLSQEAVAEILGTSQQRVGDAVLDLQAEKLLRTETPSGRSHVQAVFPEPKPVMTDEERRYRSTQVATGLPGPPLPPAVLRRLTSLVNNLPENGDGLEKLRAALGADGTDRDTRTLVFRHAINTRTSFLRSFKELRYSERKGYADLVTAVRNLIGQTQSPDNQDLSSSPKSDFSPESPTTPNPFSVEGDGGGMAAAKAKQPVAGADLEFRTELQKKFAGKPIPTAHQCKQTFAALIERKLSPSGFLKFLTAEKMEPISHPGALPALIDDYESTAAAPVTKGCPYCHTVKPLRDGKCVACGKTPELARIAAERRARGDGPQGR